MHALFLPLTLFALVTLFTPGPNNVLLTASGATFGIRRTLPHLLGVCIGFPVMVVLVGMGLAGLFSASVMLHQGLKAAGAAYFVYRAYRIATAPTVMTEGDARVRPMRFWEAVAFQWVNPKGWMMAIGAVSSYTTVKGDNFAEILVIAAVFLVLGFPSSALWAGFGVMVRRWLADPRHIRSFNIVMAALLIASIVPLVRE